MRISAVLPLILITLSSALSFGSDICSSPASPPFHGKTKSGQFIICTAQQLASIADHPELLSEKFVLKANIDLKDYYSSAKQFRISRGRLQIGSEHTFTGEFDGENHTIKGFRYFDPTAYFVGLFGNTLNATIKNLVIDDAQTEGLYHVGVLIGKAWETKIENVVIKNSSAKGEQVVGVIAGSHYDFEDAKKSFGKDKKSIIINKDAGISKCFVHGAAQGLVRHTGGLVGHNRLPIQNTASLVQVYSSGQWHGTLIGYLEERKIQSWLGLATGAERQSIRDIREKSLLKDIRFLETNMMDIIPSLKEDWRNLYLPSMAFQLRKLLRRESQSDLEKYLLGESPLSICGSTNDNSSSCRKKTSASSLQQYEVEALLQIHEIESAIMPAPNYFEDSIQITDKETFSNPYKDYNGELVAP